MTVRRNGDTGCGAQQAEAEGRIASEYDAGVILPVVPKIRGRTGELARLECAGPLVGRPLRASGLDHGRVERALGCDEGHHQLAAFRGAVERQTSARSPERHPLTELFVFELFRVALCFELQRAR